MNKCIKTMVISLLLVLSMPMAKLSAQVSVWDGTHEPWTHGTGTEADPFLIENAQQLAYLAYRVNNGLDAGGGHVSNPDYHYKLMIDVDLNGSEDFQWTPIGYYIPDMDQQHFGGYFDGNGHTISNLYINSSDCFVGFFGSTEGATIQNLSIRGLLIATNNSYGVAGGIVGDAYISKILNCNNTCNISFTSRGGGIVGYTCGTTITNCYNTGNVFGSSVSDYCCSGGIVGASLCGVGFTTAISNCYNLGCVSSSVSASYSYCCSSGGILGFIDSNTTIINNCFNEGNVFSSNSDNSSCSGGIVGKSYYQGAHSVTNCYNTGIVSSNNSGGIIGYNQNGCNVTNCYYLNNCGGNNTNGTPMSVDAMKSEEFVEILNNGYCEWEYDSNNNNSGYPILTMLILELTTSNATNITQSHATLHGTIAAVENATIQSQGFQYKEGVNSEYHTIVVSGSGAISQTLSGLKHNTTYYYRTFCTIDGCETYYGEEKLFTTLNINLIVFDPTDLTDSSATFHGYIDGGDAEIVDQGFIYCPDDNVLEDWTFVNVENTGDISATVSNLAPGLYWCGVFATFNYGIYYGEYGYGFNISWFNNDTICINNAEMLRWVAEQCNSGITFEGKCVKLMNDIELSLNVPNNMISIGSYPDYPFKGTFDGNGKLISNLYIDQPNTPYQGFFGYTLNANLYNVGLVNITASGRNYTGGMVAYAENTHMRDCYVNGGTLFALNYCGGLVGYQEQGTNSIISGCYNTCSVSGNHYVGGLVGFSNYSTVRNSYVAAPVLGQGDAIGAIIGGANEVLMYYCYFSTEITGQTNAIGENNFKDGEGMTNAQMRDPQFVNTLNQGLVTPVWMADYTTHINNGFPIIKWQRPGTSVEEHDAEKQFVSIYPNPTNNIVTIEAENLKRITISNTLGQIIYSDKAEGNAFEYDFSNHNAGIYLIRIETESGVAVKKVLVER